MIEKIQGLTEERTKLCERLKQLNVLSTGRDRVVDRIEMIDKELQSLQPP